MGVILCQASTLLNLRLRGQLDPAARMLFFCISTYLCYRLKLMNKNKENFGRLLILTDLGVVRVLNFKEAGDDPQNLAHLVERSSDQMGSPRGSETTDGPGKFNRGAAAGHGEAMSHAETKLDMEVEKRAIAQVAKEICEVVANLDCSSFVLAAPQEHLKRLEADMDSACREKLHQSIGADLTKSSLKELEKRFI